jgi:hypothetical protein
MIELGDPTIYATPQAGRVIVRTVTPGKYNYMARVAIYYHDGREEFYQAIHTQQERSHPSGLV